MKRLLQLCMESELAISFTSDPVEGPYGIVIETDGKNFFLRFWIGQGKDQTFLEPIPLQKGTPDDFLLHPRAKTEIFRILNVAKKHQSQEPQSIIDVLKVIGEVG